jgi:RNA polymerase sigma factor (sigma-70 family)
MSTFNQDQLATIVNREVKKAVNRSFFNSTSHFDKSDLESYLMIRAWEYATLKYDSTKNGNFQAYIRTLLKQFTLNFFKSPNNINVTAVQSDYVFDYITGDKITKEEAILRGLDLELCDTAFTTGHNVSNFSQFEEEDEDGDASNFDEIMNFGSQSVSAKAIDGLMLSEFLETLTDRQRLIVELRAGILDNLSFEEYEIAREILDTHASKKASEVYLSNIDIAKIIGIGRNKVQNHLVRIAEKALDFGLEELV